MKAEIRIGTASWTDPGFVEDWQKLPASVRLHWSAEHFNYVEVNATFYPLPVGAAVFHDGERVERDWRFCDLTI